MGQKIYIELTPSQARHMEELDQGGVLQPSDQPSDRGNIYVLDTASPNYSVFVEALNADELLIPVYQQIAAKIPTHPLTMSAEDIDAFKQKFGEHFGEKTKQEPIENVSTVELPPNFDFVQRITGVPEIPELIDVMTKGPGNPPAIFEIESTPDLKAKGIRSFVVAVDRDDISGDQRDQLERFIVVMDKHFATNDMMAFVQEVGVDLANTYEAAKSLLTKPE